jgi:hypothetical protein
MHLRNEIFQTEQLESIEGFFFTGKRYNASGRTAPCSSPSSMPITDRHSGREIDRDKTKRIRDEDGGRVRVCAGVRVARCLPVTRHRDYGSNLILRKARLGVKLRREPFFDLGEGRGLGEWLCACDGHTDTHTHIRVDGSTTYCQRDQKECSSIAP